MAKVGKFAVVRKLIGIFWGGEQGEPEGQGSKCGSHEIPNCGISADPSQGLTHGTAGTFPSPILSLHCLAPGLTGGWSDNCCLQRRYL